MYIFLKINFVCFFLFLFENQFTKVIPNEQKKITSVSILVVILCAPTVEEPRLFFLEIFSKYPYWSFLCEVDLVLSYVVNSLFITGAVNEWYSF